MPLRPFCQILMPFLDLLRPKTDAFTCGAAAEIAADPSTDKRHGAAYRNQLAASFLYKLFLAGARRNKTLPTHFASALTPFIPAASQPLSAGAES